MKKYGIIGSGQYNWDVIKLREYPNGFVPGKRNPFTETILTEEVGGTCGNIMCMLSRLGWDARPQLKIINTEEGQKLTDSLASYGCDVRHVHLTPNGGFSGMICTHRKNKNSVNMNWGCGHLVPMVLNSVRLQNCEQEMKFQLFLTQSQLLLMFISLTTVKRVLVKSQKNCTKEAH